MASEDGDSGGEAKQIAMVLRIARLMKLARLIRLLRFFKELWLLVASFGSAFKTLVWTFILLVIVLYVFGILFVKVLGKNTTNEDISVWFGTLPGAMFTLFQVMTLEGWSDIARVIWETQHKAMFFVLLLFIMICSFAIMNTVLAVIVEHTLCEAVAQREDLVKKAEEELNRVAGRLLHVFRQADSDCSGLLSKEEFVGALQLPDTRTLCQEMDLGEDFSCLDPEEIAMLFDTMDIDGNEELTPQEFVAGIMQMRGTARARRVFELHCEMLKMRNALHTELGEMRKAIKEMNGLSVTVMKELNEESCSGDMASQRRPSKSKALSPNGRSPTFLQVADEPPLGSDSKPKDAANNGADNWQLKPRGSATEARIDSGILDQLTNQLEMQANMRALESKVDAGFALMEQRLSKITDSLESLAQSKPLQPAQAWEA